MWGHQFDVRSLGNATYSYCNEHDHGAGESRVNPLAVYAAHSFADDQSYQVSYRCESNACLRFTLVAP
jgi:hypothetical protein